MGKVRPKQGASRQVLLQPGGIPLLAYIPVRFDLYRTVRPALRWTLQNLVAFANRAGRCFPSVRTLAAAAGVSKSTASRHLAELGSVEIHRELMTAAAR